MEHQMQAKTNLTAITTTHQARIGPLSAAWVYPRRDARRNRWKESRFLSGQKTDCRQKEPTTSPHAQCVDPSRILCESLAPPYKGCDVGMEGLLGPVNAIVFRLIAYQEPDPSSAIPQPWHFRGLASPLLQDPVIPCDPRLEQ